MLRKRRIAIRRNQFR